MDKIIRGIHQFQDQVYGKLQTLFQELASGQHPRALFITCSDSRVDPNLLTQTQPGELFVVRNAGNIVAPYSSQPAAETAAIEYALDVLEITNIIICGHAKCGAMGGLLKVEELDSLPSVKAWLSHAESARQIVQKKFPNKKGDELLSATINQNVLVQIDNLKTHPAVASGLATDRLTLHGWVYNFETGEVMNHHAESNKFVTLE